MVVPGSMGFELKLSEGEGKKERKLQLILIVGVYFDNMMKISICLMVAQVSRAYATRAGGHYALEMAPAVNDGSCTYPANCPNKVLPRADKVQRGWSN